MNCIILYNFVKCVNDAFENKCKISTRFSEAALRILDFSVLLDLHDFSASGYYEGEITDEMERKCSKRTKNHQIMMSKRSYYASYPTEYA